jgi:hypothetical protein
MTSSWVEVAAAALSLAGFGGCLLAVRGLIAERDEWREVAGRLALCVRVDAWPVVEHRMDDGGVVFEGTTAIDAPASVRGRPFAIVPMPPSVAVIGSATQVRWWEKEAASALTAYNALEPGRSGR